MSSSQPHLVSLVLSSKKALQHGEQLCTHASNLSATTSNSSIDVLALDAKVRWMSDAVLDQLQAAKQIAKSIQEKREYLLRQVDEFDTHRIQRTNELDAILESLSTQCVPPSFHQPAIEDEDEFSPFTLPNVVSPKDKGTWKNLRDFVDDNAIDAILDNIENERSELEDSLSSTSDYSSTLSRTIDVIGKNAAVPEDAETKDVIKIIEKTLNAQDALKTDMAKHLESLAGHYEQMSSALRDSESGEEFGEEDINEMNRDTDELPAIMAELEESVEGIADAQKTLHDTQSTLDAHLSKLKDTLDDLDELGDIMGDMLNNQDTVERDTQIHLQSLHNNLATVSALHSSYAAYQLSYSKLVLELARRRSYMEAAEGIVRGMREQLTAMALEEARVRAHFTADYGTHIPEDICLCIGDMPIRWDIVPDQILSGSRKEEILPQIPDDSLAEAKDIITRSDADPSSAGGTVNGMDSL